MDSINIEKCCRNIATFQADETTRCEFPAAALRLLSPATGD
jgi:hypothetical protein